MGKPIVRDFTQGKGILKFFPYQGAACGDGGPLVTGNKCDFGINDDANKI